MPISQAQRNAAFGQPGKVARTTVRTPWGIDVVVHVLVVDRFKAACKDAAKLAWKPRRIDSFNPRPIRGYTDRWSMHAYALAYDFFATGPGVPPPGGVWTPDNGVPPEFAACFERQGFRWGGKWSTRRDVPHIEWAEAPPSATTVTPPKETTNVAVNPYCPKLVRDSRNSKLYRVAIDGSQKVWIQSSTAAAVDKLFLGVDNDDEIQANAANLHAWLDSIPTVVP